MKHATQEDVDRMATTIESVVCNLDYKVDGVAIRPSLSTRASMVLVLRDLADSIRTGKAFSGDPAQADADRLAAENERLRIALYEVVDSEGMAAAYRERFDAGIVDARALLAGPGKEAAR